jgi:hypothetical protein
LAINQNPEKRSFRILTARLIFSTARLDKIPCSALPQQSKRSGATQILTFKPKPIPIASAHIDNFKSGRQSIDEQA